jgi:hypothetical protein
MRGYLPPNAQYNSMKNGLCADAAHLKKCSNSSANLRIGGGGELRIADIKSSMLLNVTEDGGNNIKMYFKWIKI